MGVECHRNVNVGIAQNSGDSQTIEDLKVSAPYRLTWGATPAIGLAACRRVARWSSRSSSGRLGLHRWRSPRSPLGAAVSCWLVGRRLQRPARQRRNRRWCRTGPGGGSRIAWLYSRSQPEYKYSCEYMVCKWFWKILYFTTMINKQHDIT